MSLQEALLQALQMKAYSDWRLSFIKLETLRDRIVKNSKGNFAQKLIQSSTDWDLFDFNHKHEILEMVSHEICHLYKIAPVAIHNLKSWKLFQSTHFPVWKMNKLTQNAQAFYLYHSYEHMEWPCIVFPTENSFSSEDFQTTLKTLAHELGHAIIDAEYRQILKKMPHLHTQWNDVQSCLDQDILEPLDTVGFMKFYEKKSLLLLNHNKSVYYNADKAFDGEKYAPESALQALWMLWEERCAYAFEHAVFSIFSDALSDIGYPLPLHNKKDSSSL